MALSLSFSETPCAACGKTHVSPVEKVVVGSGVLAQLPTLLKEKGIQKPFLLSDQNTYKAAGEQVALLLQKAGFPFSQHVLQGERIEPDEHACGAALLHFDPSCDGVIAIGSGVVGDISKILAKSGERPLITVATAPSMDGFASATSSMVRDGLKVTLPSCCPCVIVGDTDILKNAPAKMLRAGLGDMLAKYVSLCEWRIGNLITGEYYCPHIACLVQDALDKCIENATGLLEGDEKAVEAVFEGLVLGGLAMAYAGVSRPASGAEHYLSHLWEMHALSRGESSELHGLQCAVGTLLVVRLYERLLKVKPDKARALAHAAAFDYGKKADALREYAGAGAEAMIALEKKEGKYDPVLHKARLEIILSHWDQILAIVREQLPPAAELEALFDRIALPKTPKEVGAENADAPKVFLFTGDIRDKYVLSRLIWDLGLEELSETILEDMR